MNLLICGSREATPAMIDYAQRAVGRAIGLLWTILVGDALGVDEAVVWACLKADYPVKVYGVRPQPRNIQGAIPAGVTYIQVAAKYTNWASLYLYRDRVMVEASDRVLGIWNGVSRGTAYSCRYARSRGKIVNLVRFGEDQA